jgi:hypothetical protein
MMSATHRPPMKSPTDDLDEFLRTVRGHNGPLSEKYRLVARKWVDEDAAARLLEECRSTELEEKKNALVAKDERLSDAAAKRLAQADPTWLERIQAEVNQRTRANRLKIVLRAIEMENMEHVSEAATQRAEMKL